MLLKNVFGPRNSKRFRLGLAVALMTWLAASAADPGFTPG